MVNNPVFIAKYVVLKVSVKMTAVITDVDDSVPSLATMPSLLWSAGVSVALIDLLSSNDFIVMTLWLNALLDCERRKAMNQGIKALLWGIVLRN